MPEERDLDEIRERKREELKRELADGSDASGEDGGSGDAPDEPVSVSGADELAALVAGHDAVLVDFYADWCGPCKMMEPVVERIAAETDAAVAKVDVDENDALATEYGVRGVPTFVVFVDGDPAERLVGGQDESRLRSLLEG